MGKAAKERKIREQGQMIADFNQRNASNSKVFFLTVCLLCLSLAGNTAILF